MEHPTAAWGKGVVLEDAEGPTVLISFEAVGIAYFNCARNLWLFALSSASQPLISRNDRCVARVKRTVTTSFCIAERLAPRLA